MPKREASGSSTAELTAKVFDQAYNVVSTDLVSCVKEFLKQSLPMSTGLLGLVGLSLGIDASKRAKLEEEKPLFHYSEQPPRLVSNYLVRGKELLQVSELLEKNNLAALIYDLKSLKLDKRAPSRTQNADLEKHASSITGLGGIGKTQLALIFAYVTSTLYENTIWINGENLSDSFRKLAGHSDISIKTKDINGRNKEDNEIVREVYSHFRGKKSLFIFDNVENNEKIEAFLPDKSKELHILITSRWNNWKGIAEPLELNVFNNEEAEKFVKKELKIATPEDIEKLLKTEKEEKESFSIPIKQDDIKSFIENIRKHTNSANIEESIQSLEKSLQEKVDEGGCCILDKVLMKQLGCLLEHLKDSFDIIDDKIVKKLCETLQHLPLALQQAVAYISQESINVKEYLAQYNGKEIEELLDSEAHIEVNGDPYAKTVMKTWLVTMDKISENKEVGDQATKILNIMAYLAPDNISQKMFLKLDMSDCKVKKAINLLKNYSMINGGIDSNFLNIHRLVQQVIRILREKEKKEEEILREGFKIFNDIGTVKITDQNSYSISCLLFCSYAIKYSSLYLKIIHLLSEESTPLSKEDFLKEAIQKNSLELVRNILQGNKESENFTKLLSDSLEKDLVQNPEMIQILVEKGAEVSPESIVDNKNCMEVLKALSQKRKLDQSVWLETVVLHVRDTKKSQQVIDYLKIGASKDKIFELLVRSVKLSALDRVMLILKNWPSLVKKPVSDKSNGAENGDNSILEVAEKRLKEISVVTRELQYGDGEVCEYSNNEDTRSAERVISYIKEVKNKMSNSPETPNSDFEEFTDNELKNARSSNSPSSDMKVDHVEQLCTRSGQVYSRSWYPF